jgi:hemolysin D
VGQPVEIKLETFPFTRYGLRHGTVLDVSRDSTSNTPPPVPRDKTAETTGQNVQPQPPSDPLYTARISLDQDTMPVDGQAIPLTPGMTVTAEIKTDRQRVIDYLLDPIRRYRHDSFQER